MRVPRDLPVAVGPEMLVRGLWPVETSSGVLVMKAFSLQKVIEMLEKVAVGWREVR